MEDKNNIRLVPEEAIKPDSVYTKRPLVWFVGRLVKMAFQSTDSIPEHMWVKVTEIDGHNLVGTLANNPVSVTHLKYGDRVVLSRVQIEKVDLTYEEWWEEINMLRAQGDYFNSWRGLPTCCSEFELAYDEGLTPRQALIQWRNWVPSID